MNHQTLLSWAVQELGYVPVESQNGESLRRLCTAPNLHKHWAYVVQHVKSETEVDHIKNNLKVFNNRKNGEGAASKSSLSLSKLDGSETLSERDMLIKELKETEFLSKKCREKTARIQTELASGAQSGIAKIQSELTAKRQSVESHHQSLNFLQLLSDEYSGKLRQLSAASGSVENHLSSMMTSQQGNSDVTSNKKTSKAAFEKLHAECLTTLKTALTTDQSAARIEPNAVKDCVKDCDNNPRILLELLLQKARALTQKVNSTEGVSTSKNGDAKAEEILREWRKALVDSSKEGDRLALEAQEAERQARLASERAKRVIQEASGCSPDKKAAILKCLAVNEKRARMNAALTQLQQLINNNVMTSSSSSSVTSSDLTQKMKQLESLKTSLMSKQRIVNVLNARNFGFEQKLGKMQDAIKMAASQELIVLASRVSRELSTRSKGVVAQRLANFKCAPEQLTLNLPQKTGLPSRSCFLPQSHSNAAISLKKIIGEKKRLFENEEFLLKAAEFDASKTGQETKFKQLVNKSKIEPTSELPAKLDLLLKEISVSN